MERDFNKEIYGARICSWLVYVLVPLGAVLDYFIYPQFFIEFAILRFVLVGIAFINRIHARFASKVYPLYYICSAAFSIVFVYSLMCNISGEGYRSDYYVGIITVMVGLILVPFPSRIYFKILIAIDLIYLATMHFIFPLPFEWRYFVENNVFLFLTTVILFFAHRYVIKLREEVNTLSGFLPICMYCKKIRDDEGYWKKLENYLSLRADVSFSHGICPQCHKKVEMELEEIE